MVNEAILQDQIADTLSKAGLNHKREVWLSEADRIDFMCDDGVGIEVKIKGSAANIARQLKRYESADNLRHLVLVTRRSVDPRPAAKPVADYVRILLEAGERVLLAGWHRDVYEIWMKELSDYKPVMYTGSESSHQKEQAKRSMMTGDSNLMIISLRSGVGLDGLQTVCSTVVFGELDWSPQVHDQVIGRVDRDGQEDEVTSIFLVSDGGSDPPMVDLLGLKGEQARGIVDPLATHEEQHSDEGRIKIMARKFLEQKGIRVDEPS